MGKISEACERADERKLAALEGATKTDQTVCFTSEAQTRMIISGFDIDYRELRDISERAGVFFAAMATHFSLRDSHEAAWTEGLLIGLFISHSPTHNN